MTRLSTKFQSQITSLIRLCGSGSLAMNLETMQCGPLRQRGHSATLFMLFAWGGNEHFPRSLVAAVVLYLVCCISLSLPFFIKLVSSSLFMALCHPLVRFFRQFWASTAGVQRLVTSCPSWHRRPTWASSAGAQTLGTSCPSWHRRLGYLSERRSRRQPPACRGCLPLVRHGTGVPPGRHPPACRGQVPLVRHGTGDLVICRNEDLGVNRRRAEAGYILSVMAQASRRGIIRRRA